MTYIQAGWSMPKISALRSLRQENQQFEVSQGRKEGDEPTQSIQNYDLTLGNTK